MYGGRARPIVFRNLSRLRCLARVTRDDEVLNWVKLTILWLVWKTPQQKKQASYAYDRIDTGEYPHADRKNRPCVGVRAAKTLTKT
jgi:hypothetical protein